jgi:hypothetical protein
MKTSRVVTFARHNAIALAALFVALGGTGYAAVTINGSSIKNGSIAGKKLKQHTLTGKQINLKKLGTVPAATKAKTASTATNATTAATAANAAELGGVAASGYLKTGCGSNTIQGYATLDETQATFPTTYTSAAPYLVSSFDCSGQSVEVKKVGAGVFDVEFPGATGEVGIGNIRACVSGEGLLCIASEPFAVNVTYIRQGADAGGFQVVARNTEDGTYEDEALDVVIF